MQELINVIDVGTGSIKASLYERKSKSCNQVAFKGVDIRLLDPSLGIIRPDVQGTAVKILKDLVFFGNEKEAAKTICIATYSMRSAKNSDEFLKKIKNECALELNILSGVDEAKFIADSVKSTENFEQFFSFDIGGGSLEFNTYDHKLLRSSSKNLGAINIFNALKINELECSMENISQIITENTVDIFVNNSVKNLPLIATGGCLSIAKKFLKMVDGKTVTRRELMGLFKKINPLAMGERVRFGIPSGKSDIFDIALGMAISIIDLSGHDVLIISSASARHGVAMDSSTFNW